MKKLSAGLVILAILVVVAGPQSIHAQTVARNARPLGYDVTREVTLTATVSSVLRHAGTGMIAGSHLLLATPSGTIDASLGKFGLQRSAVAATISGQSVEVTGVMKALKAKPVFLVRRLKIGDETYTIRDEHGVVLSPQARERASQRMGRKGESL
jgi:hypothetical protein